MSLNKISNLWWIRFFFFFCFVLFRKWEVDNCMIPSNYSKVFFQEAVMSTLLYGCTTWTLTKCIVKKLDVNYTRMLRVILNKSWKQHQKEKKQQLYGHLHPIAKTLQIRQTRHTAHWWRSKDELISVVLLRTPLHGRASVGRLARTCINNSSVRTQDVV